jgi:NADPH:quinone reductase-like Zn-dependent oxidoreductase
VIAAFALALDWRRGHALYIGCMTEQSPEFAGLAALVTGGASGIGLATARLLAARGARVAVLDRDEVAVLDRDEGVKAGSESADLYRSSPT